VRMMEVAGWWAIGLATTGFSLQRESEERRTAMNTRCLFHARQSTSQQCLQHRAAPPMGGECLYGSCAVECCEEGR
jgi:hypothetical protein